MELDLGEHSAWMRRRLAQHVLRAASQYVIHCCCSGHEEAQQRRATRQHYHAACHSLLSHPLTVLLFLTATATTSWSFTAQLQGARGDSIGLNVAMTLSFLLHCAGHEEAQRLRAANKHWHVKALALKHSAINGITHPEEGVGGASFANDGRGEYPNNAALVSRSVGVLWMMFSHRVGYLCTGRPHWLSDQ